MASAADFFADARAHMADSQLRPNKVTDPRILQAMRSLPRERFVPAAAASLAYADEDVPLGKGRVLMEPMVLARLLQVAAPVAGELALVVGAGTGYGAAVLAACGVRVTALEEDPDLFAQAQALLATLAPGVTLVAGPLAAGWPAGAPYDVILIEGAVHQVPPAIARQLRVEGGRLVGVIGGVDRTNQAILAEATPAGLRAAPIFDCGTPLLPSLIPAPAFVF
ncbi:MAG: protein-L-isoaspartate O-methyltransferase [Acetobacteraceae bacterium]|nr:protein-L-isoaspartate O-methyltransferase [Acetobacteraceae bacterium]